MDSLTGRSPLSQQDWETNRGGRTAATERWKRTLISPFFFQSACACLQHWCIHLWGKTKQDEDYICVRISKTRATPIKPPLSPLGVCTRRETPNCTGESLCISKCNTTVLDFSILFVWSGVSIPIYFKLCKKRLWAGYFFIYVLFFILGSFHVLFFSALGLVGSSHCRLGQCLTYTFLILRRQVVSIMCEKCLL